MENIDIPSLLQSMSKNMIRLEIGETDGTCIGQFGGLPDVPQDFSWPVFETETFHDKEIRPRPLSSLAQFQCDALAPFDLEGLLPHTGILSFFYELDSQRWGFSPEDSGCAKTYWFPDKSILSPADFPSELETDYRLPQFEIHAAAEKSYPDFEDFSLAYPELSNPAYWKDIPEGWDKFYDEYDKSLDLLRAKNQPSGHSLLGWPMIIQNNMTCECELVRRGYYLGSSWKNIPEKQIKAAEQNSLTDWLLLFQLNSVECEDYYLDFGDCGSLYFYIRKEDLSARRFDQVWLIQQCY